MRGSWTRILAAAAWLVTAAVANIYEHGNDFVPDHILRVTAKNISVNCESRYSVVINGTSPGPPLNLIEGQKSWIRVYNDIPNENVTIHWHGLAQRAAPFSDGTPLVSQWPIPPNHFFDYELYHDSAGTFFYHSHVGFQAVSAYGPLIIRESCPGGKTVPYDEEKTIAIADYYNRTDHQIESGLLANPFRWSGEINALQLNGKSGTSLRNGYNSSCAPLVISVKPSTRYKLRFIGGTALSLALLGIEEHNNLSVIEADGTSSKPYNVNHLQLASGQRFSVILRTKSLRELRALNRTSFWLRMENRERPGSASGYALIKYIVPAADPLPKELPTTSPVTLPTKVYDWLEYALTPADPKKMPFPKKADRTVIITTRQYGQQNATGAFISTLEWGQNGNIWQPERFQVPYLVDFYLRGKDAVPDYAAALRNNGWDPKTAAFPAKVGEIVDIIWESNNSPTGGWDFHPFHAHGVHYWDLGSGNGTYDAAANEARLAQLRANASWTPMVRDTTLLYRYAPSGVKNTTAGWRAWRVRNDQAGAFLLHCHILQHHIMGMATAWVVGDATDLQSVWPEPPYVRGYLAFGGSAYGNDTYNPKVNHYFPEGLRVQEECAARGFGTSKKRRHVREWFGSVLHSLKS